MQPMLGMLIFLKFGEGVSLWGGHLRCQTGRSTGRVYKALRYLL